MLNDFVFCPYSVYLHNVYMNTDEDVYHSYSQTRGKLAHSSIDNKTYSTNTNELLSIPIYSHELEIKGKIDQYKINEKKLIERKYKLTQIYQGQIYQLWAQYFCMMEMGYFVKELMFYEMSKNKMYPINIPTDNDKQQLKDFIFQFKNYNPTTSLNINTAKCMHCIYSPLCDKTSVENVY
ncbi:MAG: type V CRISPR-associated protein Cas4 [Bacteroidales bacterium]|nr:type V CRISPR-associated protein Cas4 [Bacteroidales bacterium]